MGWEFFSHWNLANLCISRCSLSPLNYIKFLTLCGRKNLFSENIVGDLFNSILEYWNQQLGILNLSLTRSNARRTTSRKWVSVLPDLAFSLLLLFCQSRSRSANSHIAQYLRISRCLSSRCAPPMRVLIFADVINEWWRRTSWLLKFWWTTDYWFRDIQRTIVRSFLCSSRAISSCKFTPKWNAIV